MAGRSGEVGEVLRAGRQGDPEVDVAVDADAGRGDRPMGEDQRLQRVLVVGELLLRLRGVQQGDLPGLLLRQEVVRHVVAVHRLLGLGRGHEDVVGAQDLVGEAEALLLELGESLAEDALILDREVVDPIQ